MDDLLQWGVVVIVLIAVTIFIVRKMSRSKGRDGVCSGCGLNGLCKKDDCCDRNDNVEKSREKRQK